jgi:alanyl-tRNA synthetase
MKIEALSREVLDLKKAQEKERTQVLQREAERVVTRLIPGQRSLVQIIEEAAADQLQAVANLLKAKGFAGVAILFGKSAGQVHVLVTVDSSLTQLFQAGKIVLELTGLLGGKGGGRPEMARGVGLDETKLPLAENRALELVAGI